MGCSRDKKAKLFFAAQKARATKSELIQLIKHRLHEPLGPTLLVLQLLIREESLSPQGMDLIRMLQRCIKEEVRAIQELLTMIQTFVEEADQPDTEEERRFDESKANRVCLPLRRK
jgi:signal transduction histidine kinase